MVAVRVSGVITADRKLEVKLPENIPAGPVDLLIQSTTTSEGDVVNPLREAARAKLAAANRLGQVHVPPHGMYEPTEDEILAAGTLSPGSRPTHELIAEDRDER
jgi:hypothetical protein